MHEQHPQDLLPIGAFARLSRLSVKQLRNYAELGLLEPAYVDQDTGYRYYQAGQARQALTIGLLRSLDVPLAAIAEVLSGTASALGQVERDLQAELERRRRTLSILRRVMADGLPQAQIRLVRQEPLRVRLTRRLAAGPDDIARATSEAIAELLAAHRPGETADEPDGPVSGPRMPVGRSAGGASGPPQLIGLFPLDVTDPVEVSAALVTAAPGDALLPGGVLAAATHVGPYDQINLTAHALLTWCAERGHQPVGPIREVYVSDPAVTSPDQLVTHLMLLLEES
ncbi:MULTISPECIES: MerR family transcriptional regulator [Streptosporangium]|uniref:DNA-binding transcriptional MerR regulator n=1 Tax=Streptosporangium brasiliense TaxID=47480 RepID=A0ABT9REG3_9ACTN|nr:MerR family transcriptional regulator [Streptosporangium brasiliense]MDP9867661.1 DNA-binding transcriptional MerR regulator [Streptosporangium brasiliense]